MRSRARPRLPCVSIAPAAAMVGGAQPAADGAGALGGDDRRLARHLVHRGRARARSGADRRRTACCPAPTTSSSTTTRRGSRCCKDVASIARASAIRSASACSAISPPPTSRCSSSQRRCQRKRPRRSAPRERSRRRRLHGRRLRRHACAATAAAAAPCAPQRSSRPASPAPCKSVCSIPRRAAKRAGLGACTGNSGAPVFRDHRRPPRRHRRRELVDRPRNIGDGCGGLTGVTPLVRYRDWITQAGKIRRNQF